MDDDLNSLPIGVVDDAPTTIKRPSCVTCARPVKVCVCHALCGKISIRTKVIVLQHPAEQNRQLRTVPLLQAGLPDDKCEVIVGKRFTNLNQLISPSTALLYPGKDARDCIDVPVGTFDQLICLDGTWPQAKIMFKKNTILHSLPKVMLNGGKRSVYLIHTQPTNFHLSTLESVARALEALEGNDDLEGKLISPLKEMVRLQFSFGAVAHGTQEEAKSIRKKEVKLGLKQFTVAPRLTDFNYDEF